jgi:hypothetical protein
MAIAGRIFEVLGIGLLSVAGFYLLAGLMPSSGWVQLSFTIYLIFSAIFAVPGACLLLLGIHLVREVREERERIEALDRDECSLHGFVCDRDGIPIAKAAVDIFIDGTQGSEPVASVQTGSRGRFAVDLHEGRYVAVVSVPEVGESSRPVTISASGNNPELEIKLDVVTPNTEKVS